MSKHEETLRIERENMDLYGNPDGPLDIVAAREETHGNFSASAKVSQDLKKTLRNGVHRLKDSSVFNDPIKREALDMICTKLARIVCGDPNCRDHWDDIAGYAELVSRSITDDL